jgi:polyisoprenoid-binding protein YceI
MNLKNRIIALATAAAIAVPALAIAKHSMRGDKDHVPMAFFKAELTGGAKIDGKTADVTISDDDANFVVNVDMKRVNTGMQLRNEHFQSKLLKGKVSAVLTVKKSDVKGKKGGSVDGKLKLNDKERPVKVNYKVDEVGDRLKVTASIKDPNATLPEPGEKKDKDNKIDGINYVDFGYEKMCYLGVCVKNDVQIRGELYISKE